MSLITKHNAIKTHKKKEKKIRNNNFVQIAVQTRKNINIKEKKCLYKF